MKIGVISDTHGLLRPEAVTCLSGVAHILHAGDIGSSAVIAALEEIAPVSAIRGNIDHDDWASAYPDTLVVKLAGRTIYMLHNLKEIDVDPASVGYDVVVSGHSHNPAIDTSDGVLYLNPGSAGPRRFTLPIALATLDLTDEAIEPQIHSIAT